MLDDLLKTFGEGTDKAKLIKIVTDLVQKHGGVSGLLERFKGAGLGDKVQSWLSQDGNQHLTGDEVESALDGDALDDAAQQLGTDRSTASSKIADFLPKVIDMLSPSGKQPSDASVTDTLSGLAGKFRPVEWAFKVSIVYGRRKYAGWNWAKGMAWSIPLECAVRHILALLVGEEIDPESGLSHRGHAQCNIIMLITFLETYPEGDDRPARGMIAPADDTDVVYDAERYVSESKEERKGETSESYVELGGSGLSPLTERAGPLVEVGETLPEALDRRSDRIDALLRQAEEEA